MAQAPKRTSTLKAYKPSLREKAQIGGERAFKVVTGREPGYAARKNIEKASALLDFVPVVGDALGVDETKRALDQRQWLQAGLTGAGTALGMVPMVGDVAGGALRAAAKGTERAAVKAALNEAERLAEAYGARRVEGYHGTTRDFGEFALPGRSRKTGGKAVYVATDPSTANYFARGEGANVRPVVADLNKVFDPANSEHLDEIEPFLRRNFAKIAPGALYGPDTALAFMRSGDYGLLEKPAVESWLKKRGYDAVRMQEQPGKETFAIFDPNKVRSRFEAQGLKAKYGIDEFTPELTPEQVALNAARYPTPAYHGTSSAHGDEGAFTAFRDMNAGDTGSYAEYMLDRRLGSHFAKDPAISNTFLRSGTEWEPSLAAENGAHILPVQLPAEHEFLDVEQPLIPWSDPNSPDFRPPPEGRTREPLRKTDQRAVEELIALEAYKRDPSLLARYLVQARAVDPEAAAGLAKNLVTGEPVLLPHEKEPVDLAEFLRNYGGNPYNDEDRKRVVDLAREALRERGYKGLRYVNTSPSETRSAKDLTSYIVFDPKDVKSRFNRGTYDPDDPHLNKARGGLVKKYGV